MKTFILSIATATDIGSVALHDKKKLLGTLTHHVDRAHHEMLPQMIRTLLKWHKIEIADLSGVAITSGPGSYTSLRMGMALAKGLCFASDLPLIPIDTLAVLLAKSWLLPLAQDGICYGLLDARRGYAYGRILGSTGTLLQDTHVCEVTLATFQPFLEEGKVYLLGSGADNYEERLKARGLVVVKGLYPQAADMGALAYELLIKGQTADLTSFTPNYLSALTYRAAKEQDAATKNS